jgi:hypothetical protein
MAEEGTLCGNGDVEKYSGANGSATADVEGYTNVYIKEAEGIICGLARYDFVTNYSSLTAIAKEMLREAAACLAAIAVISYDMSGYTSRIEAEDMINILWEKFKILKPIIEDQKFVTWSQS